MKNIYFLFIIFLAVFIQSCTDENEECLTTLTYDAYTPVYVNLEEMQNNVTTSDAQVIDNPGGLYLYGQYIFINELNKGIHLIDNSNPLNPVNIGFISIPGNIGMAAKDNILFANNFYDLWSLDISDPLNVSLENVVKNAFENDLPAESQDLIIVDWEIESKTISYDCNEIFIDNFTESAVLFNDAGSKGSESLVPTGQNTTGIGGSTARFTLTGNYLYTVGTNFLKPFDVSNPVAPASGENIFIGSNIETIFPYQNSLFIGSQFGMYIYDNTNPISPVLVGSYEHTRSCDPVIVDGNYAYVTLRSGNTCWTDITNQLDLIDISDLSEPTLIKSFPMDNPHGLGKDQSNLFICEGEFGLKRFNANDPLTIDENLIEHIKNIHAYDVIPYQNNLIMVGNDGLYQYDYSDPNNLVLLSKISYAN